MQADDCYYSKEKTNLINFHPRYLQKVEEVSMFVQICVSTFLLQGVVLNAKKRSEK